MEVTKSLVKAMAGIETDIDQDSESLKEILKVRAEKYESEYTQVCNENSERYIRALKQAREKVNSRGVYIIIRHNYLTASVFRAHCQSIIFFTPQNNP